MLINGRASGLFISAIVSPMSRPESPAIEIISPVVASGISTLLSPS